MSRLIDADALIDKAETVLDEHETIWFDAVSVDNIDSAPTIDAVSVEWIPCSERLPKRQGYYICTCKDGSKYKRTTVVKWSNGWQLTGARAYWIVLAWMPLPKPYGERSVT